VIPATRILYATDILSPDDMTRRISRSRQSEAATRLFARLCGAGFSPAAQSRSHSRGVVAVAAGDAMGLSLGVDIEWMAPGRPIEAIARNFLTSAPQGLKIADFYCGWTFHEAYYKAFQRIPNETLVRETVARTTDGLAFQLADGTQVMQQCVAEIFRLCLVWRYAGPGTVSVEWRWNGGQ
jgi:hypothetical protein